MPWPRRRAGCRRATSSCATPTRRAPCPLPPCCGAYSKSWISSISLLLKLAHDAGDKLMFLSCSLTPTTYPTNPRGIRSRCPSLAQTPLDSRVRQYRVTFVGKAEHNTETYGHYTIIPGLRSRSVRIAVIWKRSQCYHSNKRSAFVYRSLSNTRSYEMPRLVYLGFPKGVIPVFSITYLSDCLSCYYQL